MRLMNRVRRFRRYAFLRLLIATLVFASLAKAELDPASKSALEQTLKVLNDPAARGKAIQGSPEAAAADKQVQSVGGAENSDRMYQIAGVIMTELVTKTNGDPAALQALLQKAQKNPAEFLQSLSPAAQKQIKDLGAKLEKPAPAKPR